jgi:hypothetical protein
MQPKFKNVLISISIALPVGLILLFGSYQLYNFIQATFGIGVRSETIIDGINVADVFIDKAYPEIKSLATQLLTLLTGVLVFSVAFSEKIINFNSAEQTTRIIMILGWTFLIMSIIANGFGLAYNAYAIPFAIADSYYATHGTIGAASFYEPFINSLIAILLSGFFFILGLICIVIAGVISINRKQPGNLEEAKLKPDPIAAGGQLK